MPLNVFVGVEINGKVELRPSVLALRYVRRGNLEIAWIARACDDIGIIDYKSQRAFICVHAVVEVVMRCNELFVWSVSDSFVKTRDLRGYRIPCASAGR